MIDEITNITVLMPTYESEAFISSAIESILNQTFKEYELLIIDDGSTDKTEEIVSNYNDERIRYVKKEHSGLGSSINYGLSIAKYDWIARMDADDLALPNRLEEQIKFLNANPNVDILSSWYGVFQQDRLKYIVKTKTGHEEIIGRMPIQNEMSSAVYKKKMVLHEGGYKNIIFEDYDLWLRLKDKAVFAVVPKVLMLYQINKNSISRKNKESSYRIAYDLQSDYYLDLEKEFGVISAKEKLSLCGWREYFYGDKNKARDFWYKLGAGWLLKPRILIAVVFTFLPASVFNYMKEIKLRLILDYFFNYFSKANRDLRSIFGQLNKHLA